MKVDSYKCDGCGNLKGDLNHWFRVVNEGRALEVYPWSAGYDNKEERHYCSDACITKAVQQWLSAQKEAQ